MEYLLVCGGRVRPKTAPRIREAALRQRQRMGEIVL